MEREGARPVRILPQARTTSDLFMTLAIQLKGGNVREWADGRRATTQGKTWKANKSDLQRQAVNCAGVERQRRERESPTSASGFRGRAEEKSGIWKSAEHA